MLCDTLYMENKHMTRLTVKQAISQDIIRKHWQPKMKCYFFSADGFGDTLFPTAFSALSTWQMKQQSRNVLLTQAGAVR